MAMIAKKEKVNKSAPKESNTLILTLGGWKLDLSLKLSKANVIELN